MKYNSLTNSLFKKIKTLLEVIKLIIKPLLYELLLNFLNLFLLQIYIVFIF